MSALRTLSRLRRTLWYAGFRHRCPFCGAFLRRFLPFGTDFPVLREFRVVGGGRRENGLCPICFCSDRERLLLLFTTERAPRLPTRSRVLHMAPERSLRRFLAEKVSGLYITGDFASPDVDLRLDVRALPFPAATFDALFCNHVLEHVPEDRVAMKELRRVLKPSAWAILQVPVGRNLAATVEGGATTREERENRFGQNDHVRIYGRDYTDRLAEAGFAVEVIPFARKIGSLAQRYGLQIEEDVFLCRPTGRA